MQSLTIPKAPCYKCKERHMHCHSECERYIYYDNLNKLAREQRQRDLESHSVTYDHMRKQWIKTNKNRFK